MSRIDTGTNELLLDLTEGVATLTLNRPAKRNALSGDLTPALRQSLLELDQDPRVRCVVLTGAGGAFCAGGDVAGMGGEQGAGSREDAPRPPLQNAIRRLAHQQEALTARLHELSRPTIAALPGPAAGAGLSIALACDLRIAADSAFITTAFRNIGLSGDYGASWFLTRLVGPARAKELFYTSRRVGAEEGLALGLFSEVVASADLATRTRELAREIASGPPIAIQYMKENLNRAEKLDLRTCLALEGDRMLRCAQTRDHREAVRAFLEKRQPVFTGQ